MGDACAATFTVVNTNATGAGSLQQALWDANTNAGPDLVHFNIPGDGPHIISPTSLQPLPSLTNTVTIDGYTQPGASPNTLTNGNNAVLKIQLDGVSAGVNHGIRIASSSNVVRGLSITRFASGSDGINIIAGANFNVIEGNLIGLNPTGSGTDFGNARNGITITSATGNLIGGTNAAARNVISDNTQYGLYLQGGAAASNNVVQGNIIGLALNGTRDGNGAGGVYLLGVPRNTIGGLIAGAGNVISGNAGAGVRLDTATTSGNVVQGNLIGTDVSGTLSRHNSGDGVLMFDAPANLIGGTNPAARNVISGNASRGIYFLDAGASDNQVLGNFIGTDISGTLAVSNTADGIAILGNRNRIGGIEPGAGNRIAYNGVVGVNLASGTNNALRGNSIFGNAFLGISSDEITITPNDSGDADSGANQLQNFPLLTNAIVTRTNITLQGSLNSRPASTFQLDFYASPACDASGNGEGQFWLGASEVATGGDGNATFSATLPGLIPGYSITATATDAAGNTSEFSPCLNALAFIPTMTFTVVNTNDSGAGSLRQALLDVNLALGRDIIEFNIPGGGVKIIRPLSALPTPLDAVFLDGYTQPGTVANTLTNGNNATLRIQIDGALAGGANVDGLRLTAPGNTVRGLTIVRFSGDGIEFNGGGGNVIQDLWVGVDIAAGPSGLVVPRRGDVSAHSGGSCGDAGVGQCSVRFDESPNSTCNSSIFICSGEAGVRAEGPGSENLFLFNCSSTFNTGPAYWIESDGATMTACYAADGPVGIQLSCNDAAAVGCTAERVGTGVLINGNNCAVEEFTCSEMAFGVRAQSGVDNVADIASACDVSEPVQLDPPAHNNQAPPASIWVGAGGDGTSAQFQQTISGPAGTYGLAFFRRMEAGGEVCFERAASFSVVKSTASPVQYSVTTATEINLQMGDQGVLHIQRGPDGFSEFSGLLTVDAARPNLTSALVATPATANVGTPQQCTATINSTGAEAVSTPRLTISLPVAATGPVEVSVNGGWVSSLTASTLICDFLPLAPGQSGSVSFRLTPTTTGLLNITATVSASGQTEFTTTDNIGTVSKTISAGLTAAPLNVTYADTISAGNDRCPISTLTGELFEPLAPDLNLGGPMRLGFSRYYASFLKRLGRIGTLGDNWRHNHEWSLTNRTTAVDVVTALGRLITFTNLAGSYQLIGRGDIAFQLHTNGSNFILADPQSQRLYTFNNAGQLVQIADGHGNTHTLNYSGNQLASVSDGLGRTLTFQYSPGGFLTNVSDGARSFALTQNGNNLVAARDPLGLATTYAYDLAHAISGLLTNTTLPEGNVPYAQTYNAQGRVATQTEAGTNTHSLAYANNLTTLTDPLGQTRRHIHSATGEMLGFRDENFEDLGLDYNASGQRTAVADRLGNLTRLSYHAPSGYIAAITNADGTFTTFAYTNRPVGGVTFFDLAQVTYADGATERFSYDANGNVLTRTDRAGNVFTFTYNARGQMLTAVNPLGGTVTNTYHADGTLAARADSDTGATLFFYDSFSRLTNVVHPDGTMLKTAYDANDRVTSITDERTNTYTFTYDDNGNVTAVTDPLSQTTQFAYDTRDRLLQTIDRLGQVARVSYDRLDHLASVTNRNGNVRLFGYDSRRRLTSVTDAGGQIWRFGYDNEALLASASNPLNQTNRIRRDALGHAVGFTNALGQSTSLVRDTLRRVTATVDALMRTNQFGYDVRGLLTNSTKPAAGTAVYQRNALGLLNRITDLNGYQWHFGHTPIGRAAYIADPLNRTNRFTYDSRGRRVRTIFADAHSVTNSLDPAGNLIRRQYSDGTDLHYTYDALDRLVAANGLGLAYDAEGRVTNTASSGVNFGATYDAGGRLTNITYNAGAFSVTYAYDSRDRLVSVSDSLTGTTLNFTHDNAGRLIGVTRPNGVNGTYTYDAAGRLTRIQEGGIIDLQYALDPAGQVTNLDYTLPLDPTNGLRQSVSNWTHDAAHQISNAGYAYDNRGRLTNAPGRAYHYDAASRLKQINSVTLGYNGFNDVITRAEGGVTNRYYYNHALELNPIVAERNENTGQILRYYVWSPGGRLLYLIDVANGNAVRHFHFDRVGTTLALTDSAGAVTDSYAYTPYGELLGRTGTSPQPFLYVGRLGVRHEPAANLAHMRARYYDPISGRFLTPDPIWPVIAQPMSLDPYQYAADNPLSFIDPRGLQSVAFADVQIQEFPVSATTGLAGALNTLELAELSTDEAMGTTGQDPVIPEKVAEARKRVEQEKARKPLVFDDIPVPLFPHETIPRSERVQWFMNQAMQTGQSGPETHESYLKWVEGQKRELTAPGSTAPSPGQSGSIWGFLEAVFGEFFNFEPPMINDGTELIDEAEESILEEIDEVIRII